MQRGVVCIAVILVFSVLVYAQNILPPSNASANKGVVATWPFGSTINVYVNTNSYPQGGTNWNAINAGLNAANSSYQMGLTFNLVGYSGNPPSPQGNYIYIYRHCLPRRKPQK